MKSEQLEFFLEIDEEDKGPKRMPFEWQHMLNGCVMPKKTCSGFFIPEEMIVNDFSEKVLFKLNEHTKKYRIEL